MPSRCGAASCEPADEVVDERRATSTGRCDRSPPRRGSPSTKNGWPSDLAGRLQPTHGGDRAAELVGRRSMNAELVGARRAEHAALLDADHVARHRPTSRRTSWRASCRWRCDAGRRAAHRRRAARLQPLLQRLAHAVSHRASHGRRRPAARSRASSSSSWRTTTGRSSAPDLVGRRVVATDGSGQRRAGRRHHRPLRTVAVPRRGDDRVAAERGEHVGQLGDARRRSASGPRPAA